MDTTYAETFGSGEKIICFSHANGFPPHAYQQFLNYFCDYTVLAHKARPLWSNDVPSKSASWKQLAQDYLDFLLKHVNQPVIGMGHSMGGTFQIFAALEHPELFHSIVLIEPLLIPVQNYVDLAVVYCLRQLFFLKENNMIEMALKRQSIFASKDEIFNRYRQKKVFSLFSDDGLWDYIDSVFEDTDDHQFKLAYAKEWEAAIYNVRLTDFLPLWKNLQSLKVPVYILKSVSKTVLFPKVIKQLNKRHPEWKIETVSDVSHLMPLEDPKKVANIILNLI